MKKNKLEYKKLKYLIYCDLYRLTGKYNSKMLIKSLKLDNSPGFKYIFFMRITKYFMQVEKTALDKLLLKILLYYNRKLQIRYGIEIPYMTKIGEGLVIPHFGGIVVNGNCEIGKNCTILQGVTIGNNLYKGKDNLSKIGDNVSIGAGAKIIGNVIIGNSVTIGANSVVTKSFPNNCVIAGNPAKIISYKEPIVLNDNYISMEEYNYH